MDARSATSARTAEPIDERVAEPPRPSFEACYAAHRDLVYRLCLRYAGRRLSFAEDVTQDVFIKLFQNFAKLDRDEPLAAWLYAVASRLCISRLRRDQSLRGWLVRAVHAEENSAPSVAQLFERNEEVSAVMTAIDRLPPRQRVALCMRAFDGKSQREIARILRVSEGYVSRLLSLARATLVVAGWENITEGDE